MAVADDEKLVRRSLRGDPQAFVELVGRHEQPLAALIRRQIADPHHRQDMLQETLLQAWKNLRTLRDGAKVRAWLVTIARNRCRDFNKSANRRERPTDEQAMQMYINRSGRAVRMDDKSADVREAVSMVSARDRWILKLFYFQGLTIAEIGERIGRPQGTVKSRLFHARRALARRLGRRSAGKESRR